MPKRNKILLTFIIVSLIIFLSVVIFYYLLNNGLGKKNSLGISDKEIKKRNETEYFSGIQDQKLKQGFASYSDNQTSFTFLGRIAGINYDGEDLKIQILWNNPDEADLMSTFKLNKFKSGGMHLVIRQKSQDMYPVSSDVESKFASGQEAMDILNSRQYMLIKAVMMLQLDNISLSKTDDYTNEMIDEFNSYKGCNVDFAGMIFEKKKTDQKCTPVINQIYYYE